MATRGFIGAIRNGRRSWRDRIHSDLSILKLLLKFQTVLFVIESLEIPLR
jgi:hypothetical protein